MDFDFSDLAPGARSVLGSFFTGVADPQLGYMWEIEVISRTRSHDYERSLFLFARNCTLPQRSIETFSRKYCGEEVSHPGHSIEPRQFNATFWDDRKLFGYRYFNQWFNIISDPRYGRQVSDENLRRDVKIRLKDRSDIFTGVEIMLKDAFLTSVGEVTLSYEESIPFIFNVTIKFTEMVINGTNYKLSKSSGGLADLDENSLKALQRQVGIGL